MSQDAFATATQSPKLPTLHACSHQKSSRITMDVMSSPWRSARDSPSRQLLWELGQLNISDRESFNAQLDREHNERAVQHKQALDAAAAEHDRVRQNAEQFRARLEEQIQAERRRREEETRRDLERLQREKEEHEILSRRREVERVKVAEARHKEATETKRLEDEATSRRKAEKERQDAEIARRSQEESAKETQRASEVAAAEAKAKKASIAAQNARAVNVVEPQAQLPPKPPARTEVRNAELEAEHVRYLGIHQQLKELRRGMASQAKQNPRLKTAMGEMRREIKKCVGQLREKKGTNKSQVCWSSLLPFCLFFCY